MSAVVKQDKLGSKQSEKCMESVLVVQLQQTEAESHPSSCNIMITAVSREAKVWNGLQSVE